ncbi:MAG TPA: L-threonylcarbamoyladenylate synthase [Fimbriimonadaceae bacterium]|jgi:L-threonylcarbamoyladenylate synthase
MLLQSSSEAIAEAASFISNGELVIVPTETVYGLAAQALDEEAVKKIFEAKGRPADNPLICHAYDKTQVEMLTASWSTQAQQLADAFWPGPLTLVLPKRNEVSAVTTGGLNTVAIRMPSHKVFREILKLVGEPVAAPSANLFMGLSPTTAQNIDPDLIKEVKLVIDGGSCEFGIESTVLDLSGEIPSLLRPGSISKDQIESVLNTQINSGSKERKSPGMYPRHYAPKGKVLIDKDIDDKPGLVLTKQPAKDQVKMPKEPRKYAAKLYAALSEMDQQNQAVIFIEAPPRTPEWDAVWDRLRRASAD